MRRRSGEAGARGLALGIHPREAQRGESKVRVFDGHVDGYLRGGAKALGIGVGVADARLADQKDGCASGEAHHGLGSHFEGTHGLQCQLLPLGGVDRAQPATAGDAE